MSGTHLDDLPEGTKLYEESSVKRVSQVIRSITGTNQKYSHMQQPDAIRALRTKLHPLFRIFDYEAPREQNSSKPPLFQNYASTVFNYIQLIPEAHAKGKNVKISFKTETRSTWQLALLPDDFWLMSGQTINHNFLFSETYRVYTAEGYNSHQEGSIQYDDGTPIEVIIYTDDTHGTPRIDVYIDGIDNPVITHNFSSSFFTYTYASAEKYALYSGMYTTGSDDLPSSYFKYLQITLEDWEVEQ